MWMALALLSIMVGTIVTAIIPSNMSEEDRKPAPWDSPPSADDEGLRWTATLKTTYDAQAYGADSRYVCKGTMVDTLGEIKTFRWYAYGCNRADAEEKALADALNVIRQAFERAEVPSTRTVRLDY